MPTDTPLHPAVPQQLTDLYGQFPAYDRLRVSAVSLSPYGPTPTLRVDLPGFPADPPPEWRAAAYDTVQCHLRFFAVEHPALTRWRPPADARLDARPVNPRLTEIHLTGTGIGPAFHANPWFVVRHISAHRAGTEHAYPSKLDARLHGTTRPTTTAETFHAR